MMKRILITGGAGFIGSNFVHFLLENEPEAEIINLDNLTYSGHIENLVDIDSSNYHFIKGDICDFDLIKQVIRDNKIDIVVHFAAETHVDRSIDSPGQFIQTNIVGTYNLIENCREIWKETGGYNNKRFHHVSTDEVFGMLGPADPAFSETTPYSPNSPYAASKASSDHLVRAYYRTYGLPITISNCSNNYGPYQFPEKLIPLVILNAISGKNLPVYGDGQQIRDWLFVEDHCKAIYTILNEGVVGETYNIGGNNQLPNLEIIKKICAILDRYMPESPNVPHQKLIQFVPDRPGHDWRYDINSQKIQSDLGWKPAYDLESGLQKTVDWYLTNLDWLEIVAGNAGFDEWMIRNYEKRRGEG